MEALAAFFLQKVATSAINKAASLLLNRFDETSVKLDALSAKIDALIIGKFRTACDYLTESASVSEPYRTKKLESSMYLFETSGNTIGTLVEARRKSVDIRYSLVGEILVSSAIKKLEFETRVYERLNEHLLNEWTWVLCHVGAFRAASELSVPELVRLKKSSLVKAASSTLQFVKNKEQELFSDIRYTSAGIGRDVGYLVNPLGWIKAGIALASWKETKESRNIMQKNYESILHEFRSALAWCGIEPHLTEEINTIESRVKLLDIFGKDSKDDKEWLAYLKGRQYDKL